MIDMIQLREDDTRQWVFKENGKVFHTIIMKHDGSVVEYWNQYDDSNKIEYIHFANGTSYKVEKDDCYAV